MAVVFRARQQILDRTVALKMILGGAIAGPEVLARFEQEARTVAQLQHPGIVQIYEVGDHNGLPYLSLEFVPGGSLHEWLRGQPLPPLEAARLIEQLSRTTHFAHERGVIHRDLKPANILLTERPPNAASDSTVLSDSAVSERSAESFVQLKIADFGLARLLGSGNNLTVTGQLIGTPSYMAPEQARGAVDEMSPALDVYSLGAILYELLTGHPPFRGATLVDTLDQVRNEEPVSPRRLQPRVPPDLETVCLKCLEKAPERRYVSALALADDLRCVQQGRAIAARPVHAAERVWKWMRRSPAIASLAAVAVLFAVIGLAGTLLETARANKNAEDARLDRDRALYHSRLANHERAAAEDQRRLAEEEKMRAVEAQAEAERQRQTAEQEKALAVEARAQADANFKSAMNAVVALTQLGRQLRNEPRQQATSRRIFDETLQFYEGFLSVRAEDQTLRVMAVIALHEAAGIRSDMGEREKARQLLDRSTELLDTLLHEHPGSAYLLVIAARSQWTRGNLLRSMSQPVEADRAYLACIATYDAMLERSSKDRTLLVHKANAIVNRCVVLQQLGRKADALEQFAVAARLLRDVARANPQDELVATELALCLDDYGNALFSEGRRGEAQPLLREALELREHLFKKSSTDHSRQIFLARSLTAVARCELAEDNFDAATAHLQRAAGLLEPFLADYPEVFQYYSELHPVYSEQVRVAIRQKGFASIGPEWQKLQDLVGRAHAKFPEDQFFRGPPQAGRISLRGAHLGDAGSQIGAAPGQRTGAGVRRDKTSRRGRCSGGCGRRRRAATTRPAHEVIALTNANGTHLGESGSGATERRTSVICKSSDACKHADGFKENLKIEFATLSRSGTTAPCLNPNELAKSLRTIS